MPKEKKQQNLFTYLLLLLLFSSACTIGVARGGGGGGGLSVSSKVGVLEKGHPLSSEGVCYGVAPVSVSAQDGIVALGKAHTHSAPSLSSLPKVALETVPIFVWLNTDRSQPWRVECRPLPFSTPLSFRRSML